MAMRTRFHLGLITLCLFAGNERAVAQFDALPDSNATWTTSFWIGPGYPYQGFHHTYDALHPDTVINGVTYQRLLESGYYAGALLDNGLGQVYHVQPGTTEPVLLYDFDVVVGDAVYGVIVSVRADQRIGVHKIEHDRMTPPAAYPARRRGLPGCARRASTRLGRTPTTLAAVACVM